MSFISFISNFDYQIKVMLAFQALPKGSSFAGAIWMSGMVESGGMLVRSCLFKRYRGIIVLSPKKVCEKTA